MDHEISPLRQMAAQMIKAPKMFSGGNPLSLEFLYHGCFATLECCLQLHGVKSDEFNLRIESLNEYNNNNKQKNPKKSRYLSTIPLASQGASDDEINAVYNPVLLRLIEKYETVLKTQEKNP